MTNELGGGWIYVMMTSSNYNRCKLGRTKGNPLERMKTLRTADPGLAFHTAYFVPHWDRKLSQIEMFFHRELAEIRILFHDGEPSEWFSKSANHVCEYLEALFQDWSEGPVTSINMLGQNRICRAYEEDLLFFYGSPSQLDPIDGIPWGGVANCGT